MEYATCSSRTSTCAVTTAITQDSSKQNEELVETNSAKALLIMPTVTTALHVKRQKSDTFNGHAALIKNITKFGLQVCINVPLDGNCLFTAVCDQLMRVFGDRRYTIHALYT